MKKVIVLIIKVIEEGKEILVHSYVSMEYRGSYDDAPTLKDIDIRERDYGGKCIGWFTAYAE